MTLSRKLGLALGFHLVLVAIACPAWGAIAYSASGAPGAGTVGLSPALAGGEDRVLALATAAVPAPADAANLAAAMSPIDSLMEGQIEQSGDLTAAERHRGTFRFLLVILIFGALIRYLTSPGYLQFISDVLDPKAF